MFRPPKGHSRPPEKVVSMEDHNIQENFVRALETRIPAKSNLAEFISETLGVEKVSAYRRLRGEVHFSLEEGVLLASKLGMSLDGTVVSSISPQRRAFIYTMPDVTDVVGMVMNSINGALSVFRNITSETAEYGAAMCTPSLPFTASNNFLRKMAFLSCMHVNGVHMPYSDFQGELEDKYNSHMDNFLAEFKNMPYAYYILDRMLIQRLMNDVRYFHNIHLLNSEDVEMMKTGALRLLDQLEMLTTDGYSHSLGQKVDIYISEFSIFSTFSYISLGNINLSVVSPFPFMFTRSDDPQFFNGVQEVLRSLKSSSILISGSARMERMKFLDEQRRIVDAL